MFRFKILSPRIFKEVFLQNLVNINRDYYYYFFFYCQVGRYILKRELQVALVLKF